MVVAGSDRCIVLPMDIYCPNAGCGEPVDMDYLHDVADDHNTDYTTVMRDFQSRGCPALDMTCTTGNDDSMAPYADAMYDLLGDDLDGAAAMLEDFQMGY